MQEGAPVVHVQVRPPGFDVTVYRVIVAPPSEVGVVHDTTLCVLPAPVAVTLVGAPGAGITRLPDASNFDTKPSTAPVAVRVNSPALGSKSAVPGK